MVHLLLQSLQRQLQEQLLQSNICYAMTTWYDSYYNQHCINLLHRTVSAATSCSNQLQQLTAAMTNHMLTTLQFDNATIHYTLLATTDLTKWKTFQVIRHKHLQTVTNICNQSELPSQLHGLWYKKYISALAVCWLTATIKAFNCSTYKHLQSALADSETMNKKNWNKTFMYWPAILEFLWNPWQRLPCFQQFQFLKPT